MVSILHPPEELPLSNLGASGTKWLQWFVRLKKYKVRGEILTEDNLQFGAGKPLCNTAMFSIPVTKSRFVPTLPIHVKCIGIREHIGITISGLCGRNYSFASFNYLQSWRVSNSRNTVEMSLTLPPRVMSTLATRRVARADAVWKRHSSSTKLGASDGAFFRSASWEGFSNKVTIPY